MIAKTSRFEMPSQPMASGAYTCPPHWATESHTVYPKGSPFCRVFQQSHIESCKLWCMGVCHYPLGSFWRKRHSLWLAKKTSN